MVPAKYANLYVSTKYFLASYRALSDGRAGILDFEKRLESVTMPLFQWKVHWIGTCAILRTAIDLFQIDAKSCLAPRLRKEIGIEWNAIKEQKTDHAIFWEFLRKERDNIMHEYKWQAYETWMNLDGTSPKSAPTILTFDADEARPVLLMKGGHFEGRNSLKLLGEAAEWVESRIFAAIRRAGYDPEEERDLVHFQPRRELGSCRPETGGEGEGL